jgi:heptosyltransferase-1
MKRILIIKTSSLGDVIHTLPALTDARQALGDVSFDWVVEESLAEIPSWHPAVDKIIPVALRRWRKAPLKAWRSGEWASFRKQVRAQQYDKVIDAQGLIKSSLLTRLVQAPRCGQSANVAREPLASWVYDEKHHVARGQHAIDRVRQLFAACLDYAAPITDPEYGIDKDQMIVSRQGKPYLVFLHGTAWKTKQWPESYWQELIQLAAAAGYEVRLLWGNNTEHERALSLARASDNTSVCEPMDLKHVASLIAGSSGVAATDTGLGHLTAALGVPSVTVYGPTRPGLTGTRGFHQQHLESSYVCAPCFKRHCKQPALKQAWPPCFAELDPARVWQELVRQMESAR